MTFFTSRTILYWKKDMLTEKDILGIFLLYDEDESPEIPFDDPDDTELSEQEDDDEDDDDDWTKDE